MLQRIDTLTSAVSALSSTIAQLQTAIVNPTAEDVAQQAALDAAIKSLGDANTALAALVAARPNPGP